MKKIIIVFLFFLLLPFSTDAKSDNLVVNLVFKPRENVKVQVKNIPAVKIYFEQIKDTRSDPRSIGENLEKKDQRILVQTSNDSEAGEFVRSVLIKEFKSKTFPVEDQAGLASKIITGTLLKFWTVETSNYDSQTQLKIEVRDKAGRVYYSHNYTGVGKNRGRSLSAVNYQESISNSMTSVIDGMFSDRDFLAALSERPALHIMTEEKAPVTTTETPPAPKPKKKPSPPPPAPSQPQPVFGPK
jgi:uncharacterized lipoprotein YajG